MLEYLLRRVSSQSIENDFEQRGLVVNVLFVHQNFPGQFKHLAPALLARGDRVAALCMGKFNGAAGFEGLQLVKATAERSSSQHIHPLVSDFETKVIRAEATCRAAIKLRDSGFLPDVIVAHPGWGESMFLKEVWPKARMGIYCEFYYHPHGADVGFDAEFSAKDSIGMACRLRLKNLSNLLHFDIAEAGISPTEWQASTFPEPFRSKISIIHDGINTEAIAPNPTVRFTIRGQNGANVTLTKKDETITFVNRNLEPYRGYHVFMRALPEILKRRPKARILLVGGDDVSYGARAPGGKKWRDIFASEVRSKISDADWSRVHFLGLIPYVSFISLLQVSTVHVYLTYPFVLSWSLLEAMSAGCAIVASNTQPLHEVIKQDETGRLVDFFDCTGLIHEVCSLLDNPVDRSRLGCNARDFARVNYDLKTVCLPRQMQWVQDLASGV